MLNWQCPCSVCSNPVRANQEGLCCDSCNLWVHAHCCDISDTQYAVLGKLGDSSPCYCSTCVLQQLPFASCSFVSDSASSGSDVDSDMNFIFLINSTVLLCHINIRTVVCNHCLMRLESFCPV